MADQDKGKLSIVSSQRMRRGMLLLMVTATTLLAVILWPRLHRAYDAAVAVIELAEVELPAFLDGRPPASKQDVRFRVGNREYRADIYRPRGRARGGVLLVHGATPHGKDDPRLAEFATVLARARFAVLVPDFADLRALRLLPETAREIRDAFTFLASRLDLAPAGRVGIGAISVALGPTMLAVLDSDISTQVRFVFALGAYYDLRRTLTYLTTGVYAAGAATTRSEPQEYGKWVFALSNASRLRDRPDGPVLVALIQRKLRDQGADVSDLVAQLGPDGKAVYEYVSNREPARAPRLLARLPEVVRSDIDALDLASRDLSGLQPRLILVHGLGDAVIPYHESVQLAAATPAGRTRLFLIGGLRHVTTRPALLDGWRSWRAMCALLAEQAR